MQARFDEALRVLTRHEVEFIVVGGIAAILQGSPLTTEDVDLVYRVSDENCRRLAAALDELGASYADPAGRIIRPDAQRLNVGQGASPEHDLRTGRSDADRGR